MMKLGISDTCDGIIMVARSRANRKSRPLNFVTAKTNAAMEQVIICPTTAMIESLKLLSVKYVKALSGRILNNCT